MWRSPSTSSRILSCAAPAGGPKGSPARAARENTAVLGTLGCGGIKHADIDDRGVCRIGRAARNSINVAACKMINDILRNT